MFVALCVVAVRVMAAVGVTVLVADRDLLWVLPQREGLVKERHVQRNRAEGSTHPWQLLLCLLQ